MDPWKPNAQRWESEVCTITSTELGDGQDYKDVTHYGVYVKCKVSGTSSRQEIVTPLAGAMTDTLTGGTSDAAHKRYLVRATQAVVASLGCENDPSVPATPPA